MNKYKVGDWVKTINLEHQDHICCDGMIGFIDEVLDVEDYKYHVVIDGKYGTFLESELEFVKLNTNPQTVLNLTRLSMRFNTQC